MHAKIKTVDQVRREPMRIAGEKLFRDRVIEIRHPYTGEVIATVPKATLADVQRALRIARDYQATLTRHERYRILMKAGEIVAARRDDLARLITLESGLCLKDTQYEVGRASDVLLFAANQALVDDGQVFSCDLTAHGKSRKVYSLKEWTAKRAVPDAFLRDVLAKPKIFVIGTEDELAKPRRAKPRSRRA